MVQIPPEEIGVKDLEDWYKLSAELKRLKAKEYLLRRKLFGHFFPEPREGTNNYDLPDGYVLKGVHTLNRDIDEGALDALMPEFEKLKLPMGVLIERKPTLKITPYRALSEENMKFFDQCLVVKPGSPSMEIVKPKKRGRK